MMGSFTEKEGEECRFFDACEDSVSSVSDLCSHCNESVEPNCRFCNRVPIEFHYDAWIRTPESVQERRDKFLRWLEPSSDRIASENYDDEYNYVLDEEVDRIAASSGAVLRTSGFVDEFCSSRSSNPCWSDDALDLSEELGLRDNSVCRIGNSFGGIECNVNELEHSIGVNELHVMGLEQPVLREEFENISGSSPSFQELLPRKDEDGSNQVYTTKRVKKGWLKRLLSLACIADGQGDTSSAFNGRVQRVTVHRSKKRLKELSALYTGQEIQAHEGSILTMKFSPNGEYLASAGEDGVVRVWQVVEDDRSNELDIPDIDPSCIYFAVNHLSELAPLFDDKEKMGKMKTLRKSSDSACVVFPQKVFRILEKPLHEFHGHDGEILDLNWSKNNYLLSASIDKTVRLWKLGCDHCLKIFRHSNYVTCVQFNPVDEDYFISGSIDGKVRIWATSSCKVVAWTDIKGIVTAVCYRPDAQGGIIGSMTGDCRFFNISDNHLQLHAQICLQRKKKSPCKRIISFQFLPQDPSKVMVSCAHSQVRMLDGTNVIGKYRGFRNTGNHIYASFTSDGKHIVSACEDSNVYVWSCIGSEKLVISKAKNIRSYERFSTNVSIAIPWCGMKHENPESKWQVCFSNDNSPVSTSPTCFSLSQEFFLDSFPKGSATWPEEKLPTSSPFAVSSTMDKSQYKFLKTSYQSTSSSQTWGLVIVTAGWDGRIRSFHNYGLPVPT